MSKKAICTTIANDHPQATRKELIQLFHSMVPGISPGAASSYASSVRQDFPQATPTVHYLAAKEETDQEIDDRLHERFSVIDKLARSACSGKIRSLVVSGAAGTGKSYTVDQAVKEYDPTGDKTASVSGFVRPTGLYLLMHEYRHAGNVIVLDDVDSALQDDVSLNLLKAALDTTKKRIISWRAETKMVDLDGEPIDREFEFKGSIIFLTNLDFDNIIAKGSKQAVHLEALQSRSLYVDSAMHSDRDYVIRIKQVCSYGMLRDMDIPSYAEQELLSFLDNNKEKFRELSLRVMIKLGNLWKVDSSGWKSLAKVSLFKPQFAR